ncbi:hypothetical protein Q0F98_08800 [Paenibacillus amylolyticus]|nr:hypothetical protein Q0F98_08800 [Paenibacillus amylolyticus]
MFSHMPGGDSAHEKIGRSLSWILERYGQKMRDNPKMVSSLARQLGRSCNLIECFHSVGWSMTLQDAKWMIDRMAAMGTNFYNFHAFSIRLVGLRSMTHHRLNFAESLLEAFPAVGGLHRTVELSHEHRAADILYCRA